MKKWVFEKDETGNKYFPWPEYEEDVTEFFEAARADCWCDFEYSIEEAHRMLEDDEVIRSADLSKIKTMLTFCVRGERFCDGHWNAMIQEGYIRKLLLRLEELNQDYR